MFFFLFRVCFELSASSENVSASRPSYCYCHSWGTIVRREAIDGGSEGLKDTFLLDNISKLVYGFSVRRKEYCPWPWIEWSNMVRKEERAERTLNL